MKKIVKAVAVLSAVSALWAQAALAQNGAPKANPVEFFACNFQDGKGMADLDKVIDKFKAYADQNERDHAALVAAIRQGRLEATPGV